MKIKSYPYIGQLVRTSFDVKTQTHTFRTECNSVRVNTNAYYGFLISNTEITEARYRYAKYFTNLPERYRNLPNGCVKTDIEIATRRPGGKPIYVNLIYMSEDGMDRIGHLFSAYEIKSIIARSEKYKSAIVHPTLWQRICMIFCR